MRACTFAICAAALAALNPLPASAGSLYTASAETYDFDRPVYRAITYYDQSYAKKAYVHRRHYVVRNYYHHRRHVHRHHRPHHVAHHRRHHRAYYRPHHRSYHHAHYFHHRRAYHRPYYDTYYSYRPYFRPAYHSYYAPRPYHHAYYGFRSYTGVSAPWTQIGLPLFVGTGCRTAYIPYGWTWYRGRDYRCW